jgi:hypothetical protein
MVIMMLCSSPHSISNKAERTALLAVDTAANSVAARPSRPHGLATDRTGGRRAILHVVQGIPK